MKRMIKKISISMFALIIVLLSIKTNTVTMKAYDQELSNGVAPIVWYGVGGEYVILDSYGNINQYIDETTAKNLGASDEMLLDENGDHWLSSGSCFFVGEKGEDPQYAVTNCHVVEDYIEQGGEPFFWNWGSVDTGLYAGILFEKTEMRILFDDIRDYEKVDVKWYGDSNKIDLALVKLKNPTDKRNALVLYDVPKDEDSKNELKGEEVTALGYPGIAYNDLTNGSDKWDANALEVTDGKINNFAYDKTDVGRFEMSATINHGNSGGPLILESAGAVIGVNTNGWTEGADQRNYAIDVEHVMDMLDDNGVEYSLSSDSSSVSEEDSSDSGSSSPTSDSGSKDSSSESGSTGIIIIIFAVVVAAVIVIVILAKKKAQGTNAQSKDDEFKTEAAPVRPVVTPAPAQAAAPQRIAMARSLAPQHNGASFSLAHGAITVGRDASVCKIVYQAGTAGVSGKHCTIEYRPSQNVFIVTDLNSSYGTMLANGTKMEPNRHYSFNPGDSIFVGDKANEIRFEVH